MSARLAPWIGCLVLLASIPANVAADDHRCANIVDERLREYGLSLAEMRDVVWRTDHFQDDPMVPEADRPVSGYRFYGRPDRCPGGRIAIDMGSGCGISDIRSRGDCRIPGIRHGWF